MYHRVISGRQPKSKQIWPRDLKVTKTNSMDVFIRLLRLIEEGISRHNCSYEGLAGMLNNEQA